VASLRSIPGRWRRFRALDRADRLLVLEAAGLLVATKGSLRALGFGRTSGLLDRVLRLRALPPAPGAIDNVRLRVEEAAGALPLSVSCLPRSMTLWSLLRRRGIDTEIRIGVRLDDDGLAAHAWVERHGAPINDSADVVERYPPFDRAVSPSVLASMD
jgi:Transglutaminase-like superfamily